jgi:hypothetical protein
MYNSDLNVFEERVDKMDTTNLAANREKLEAEAGQQEVPIEETTVETIGAL